MTAALSEQLTLPSGVWQLDNIHSRVGFVVDFIAGPFYAEFTEFEATFDTTGAEPHLHGSTAPESVNVRLVPFRNHLLGPEFFDVKNHPRIEFSSRSFSAADEELVVEADLRVRGVSLSCTGRGAVHGPVVNQFGIPAMGISLTCEVDRHDFGIDWQVPLPGGRLGLGDDVRLAADIQFTLEKADSNE